MDDVNTVTSLGNALVKRVRRLQEKTRSREKEQAFFVEGLPITLMAHEHDAPFDTVIYAPTLLIDAQGRDIVEQQRASGTPCIAVSSDVFRHISQRNNPDGIGAICKTVWQRLDDAVPNAMDIFVAMERISDPGNLGTILRTIDSVPAAGVILVGQSTHPFHPRTVRSSRGTIFTVPLYHCPDMNSVFNWASTRQVNTVATSANVPNCFWNVSYSLPTLCIFGNEHSGLDQATIDTADQVISIPMAGNASSLNVTISVGLLLYEIKRTQQTG